MGFLALQSSRAGVTSAEDLSADDVAARCGLHSSRLAPCPGHGDPALDVPAGRQGGAGRQAVSMHKLFHGL